MKNTSKYASLTHEELLQKLNEMEVENQWLKEQIQYLQKLRMGSKSYTKTKEKERGKL